MPERTRYANGVPSWVDLGTTDTEGAKAFYGALFGWEATDMPALDDMTYTMFSRDGKMVAGMGELTADQVDAGMPPAWTTYLNVADLDDAIARVPVAGGTVIVPPLDVMDTGRMALIADPTGAALGLWQPGTHIGAQLVNEHGALSWNELITDDTEAAADFYAEAFGWRTEVADTPNGPYTAFWADGNVEGNAAAGMMAKNKGMGPMPNAWGVYFSADDVDAATETIETNGGGVVMPAMDLPGVGRMAVVHDPQGAMFTVIKLANEQR